jgi:alanyl-tRNA synthetase
MVVACAKGSDLDARDLLKKHLAPFNGRGGGDVSLAQGGGVAEESALAGLFKDTKSCLKANY